MSIDQLQLNYKKVAAEYGGDIQRIAQAADSGALGEYGALVAGAAADYIKRTRAAAQNQAAPQQTVYEKLLSPQTPAGLGAMPEAAMSPLALNAQMPPTAPQGGLGAAPQAPAPQMAPEAMMAGGGVAALPIPDDMFEETDNYYGGGGLVAFAGGTDEYGVQADSEEEKSLFEQILAEQAAQQAAAQQAAASAAPAGKTFYGYSADNPLANAPIIEKLFGKPETKYADAIAKELEAQYTPEYEKKRLSQDKWATLGKMAGIIGTTPGTIFQAVNAGIKGVMPDVEEAAKQRRAEKRELQKGLLDLENGRNTMAAQRAARYLDAQQIAIRGQEAEAGREFEAEQNANRIRAQREIALMEQNREDARARAKADSEKELNFGSDNVEIKGPTPDQNITIPRMRAQVRGSKEFGYIFPQLSDKVVKPSYGSYALGVHNAMKFAQAKGLAFQVSDTGDLQFGGTKDGWKTISPRRIRQFEKMGRDFDPSIYSMTLKPLSED